mgnify:CR=1 FL=1|tara:strand:+ start:5562 stop:6464 length:903 start_codon:yes stop_codon:yes gene_type:complete
MDKNQKNDSLNNSKVNDSINIYTTKDQNNHEYVINYLLDSDKDLIDNDIIHKRVTEYIDNYYSDEYKEYINYIQHIYKKFVKKNFYIKNNNVNIKVFKIKEDKIIINLIKPKQINIETELNSLKDDINVKRNILTKEYRNLMMEDNVIPNIKNKFIDKKNEFIVLLEKYYIYDLYFRKINNIRSDIDTSKIFYSKLITTLNQDNEYINLLNLDFYDVDNHIIDKINQHDIQKLNDYNEIKEMINFDNTDKNLLREKIINYLDKTENKQNNKLLKQNIIKQDNLIYDLILEKPKVKSKIKL